LPTWIVTKANTHNKVGFGLEESAINQHYIWDNHLTHLSTTAEAEGAKVFTYGLVLCSNIHSDFISWFHGIHSMVGSFPSDCIMVCSRV
jgi:hypothetical protein